MPTLSFIAFHMRDYQRDTQQLPLEGHGAYFLLLQHCWTHGSIPPDDVARAAICKVTVQRWRKQLAPLVAGYFDASGQNKRANVEIAKAEKLRTKQAMAGHNGGMASAFRKAERRAMAEAAAQAVAKPRLTHGSSGGEAIKKDIINTTSGAARAREAEPPDKSTAEPAAAAASGLAMGTRGNGIATSGSLAEVIAQKGWVS